MMAKQGLGTADDELCPIGLVNLGPSPYPDDVHNASTTIAELPPQLLEALKPAGLRAGAEASSPPSARSLEAQDAISELVSLDELVNLDELLRLDEDEPKTLLLDTVVLDAESLPPLEAIPLEEAPPQTIELHVIRESMPLVAVESELARLPRPWIIAGALVASVSIAGAMALFCWTIAKLVF